MKVGIIHERTKTFYWEGGDREILQCKFPRKAYFGNILCKFKKFKFSRGEGGGDHPPPPEHTCYQVEIGFDRSL